jgi:hypothetical protein
MLHGKTLAGTLAAAGTALLLAMAASPASAQGTWTIVTAPPTGQNGELAGVASVSATDAWAVGTTGGELNGVGTKILIDNWNGTAWTQSTTPTTAGNTAYLTGVSASSTTDAWAVGHTAVNREDFAPLALHWNGTAWSVSTSAPSAVSGDGIGVADISPTNAYLLTYSASFAAGFLAQWNGTTWSRVTLPAPPNNGESSTLNAIAANGPDDVWIVGSYLSPTTGGDQTYTLHYNGTAWSIVPMPSSGSASLVYDFDSLQVDSPTDVWAVGGSGTDIPAIGGGTTSSLIEHWNGTAWSVVSSPSPGTGDDLTGVTTSNAASDVWAVGYYTPSGATEAQTLTLNWNGTAWTTVTSPDNGSPSLLFSAATNPGAAIVWAVGYSGTCCTGENPLVLQNG